MYNFLIKNKISIISISTILIVSTILITSSNKDIVETSNEISENFEQKITRLETQNTSAEQLKIESGLVSEITNVEKEVKKLDDFQDTAEESIISKSEDTNLESNELDSYGSYIDIKLSENVKPKEEYFNEIDQTKIIEKGRADGFNVENTNLLKNSPSSDNIGVNLDDEHYNEIDQTTINNIGVTNGTIIPKIGGYNKVVNEATISENSNDATDLEIDQQTIIDNAKLQGLI